MSPLSLPSTLAVFGAGVVSFLSPCVLPLVPGYISLISGASVEELQSQDHKLLRAVLLHSIMFILGFTLVFVTLGAAATEVGQLTKLSRKQLTWIAEAVVILCGLQLATNVKITALHADKRLPSVGSRKSPIGAILGASACAFGRTPI